MASQFPVGSMVWAKITGRDPFWPGFIVNHDDCGLEDQNDKVCVFWICNNRVSMVPTKYIQDYWDSFEVNVRHVKGTNLLNAVNESIKLYCNRAFKTEVSHLDYAGRKKFMKSIDTQRTKHEDYTLPECVSFTLRKIKNINLPPEIPKSEDSHGMDIFFDSLKQKNISDPQIFCCFCVCSVKTIEERHPFAKLGLCFKCKLFCTVCGQDASNWSSEDFMMAFCNSCQKNVHQKGSLKIDMKLSELILSTLFWPKPLEEELKRIKNPDLNYFIDSTELNVLHLSLADTKENDEEKNTLVSHHFLGMKKTIKMHVEYKTFSDMKNDKVSLDKYKIIIGKPYKTGDVWSKESKRCLYLKNIYVEFFMEFYKLISPHITEKLWFYEMPAAVKGEFCGTISRFMNVWPYVILPSKLTVAYSPFEYHRLVWTNTCLDISDIRSLLSCTQI